MNIHYHKMTGEIILWDSSSRPAGSTESHFADHVVALIETDSVDPKSQKIANGRLVEKTREETALAFLPNEHEVKHAIAYELHHTDGFVSPPSDRPLKGHLALDWKPYRQALRDLSKLKGQAEMVRAWPLRPDGTDAITPLRQRVPSKGRSGLK